MKVKEKIRRNKKRGDLRGVGMSVADRGEGDLRGERDDRREGGIEGEGNNKSFEFREQVILGI